MMRNTIGALFALTLAGCVSGRDMIGPEDPAYTVVCVDSLVTDTTVACWSAPAVITIVIVNPVIG